jgi:hypothetical protein
VAFDPPFFETPDAAGAIIRAIRLNPREEVRFSARRTDSCPALRYALLYWKRLFDTFH